MSIQDEIAARAVVDLAREFGSQLAEPTTRSYDGSGEAGIVVPMAGKYRALVLTVRIRSSPTLGVWRCELIPLACWGHLVMQLGLSVQKKSRERPEELAGRHAKAMARQPFFEIIRKECAT